MCYPQDTSTLHFTLVSLVWVPKWIGLRSTRPEPSIISLSFGLPVLALFWCYWPLLGTYTPHAMDLIERRKLGLSIEYNVSFGLSYNIFVFDRLQNECFLCSIGWIFCYARVMNIALFLKLDDEKKESLWNRANVLENWKSPCWIFFSSSKENESRSPLKKAKNKT